MSAPYSANSSHQGQPRRETLRERFERVLHQKNSVTDRLARLEQTTGVDRVYLVSGFIAFIAIYLMFGYGAAFICNLICFLYPAYASIKAIETPGATEQVTQCLMYWIIYSFLITLEYSVNFLVYYIPLYWFIKCLFLVWCFAPIEFNGSAVVYFKVVRPLFLRHQSDIDHAAEHANVVVTEAISRAKNRVQENVQENIQENVENIFEENAVQHFE